jgi:hypothetical protein
MAEEEKTIRSIFYEIENQIDVYNGLLKRMDRNIANHKLSEYYEGLLLGKKQAYEEMIDVLHSISNRLYARIHQNDDEAD